MPRKALLQIRRGLKAQLPTLADGELGFCTDTEELYVGTTNGNKCIGTGADMFKSVYDTNNNGKVDNAEKADSVPWTGVTGKPTTFTPASHTHTASDLPSASTSAKGVVQLSTATSSTSTALAATASAVKAAYDLAASKWTYNESTIKGIKVNNASAADKWSTSRTLSLSGILTGSATIDGSEDVTLQADINYGHGLTLDENGLLAVDVDGETIKINPYDAERFGKLYVPLASTSNKGVVQLSNSTTSSSTTLAATANAVRLAYNLAASKAEANHTHSLADIIDWSGGGSAIDQGYYTGNGQSYRYIYFPTVTDACLLFIRGDNGSDGGGGNGLFLAVYSPLMKSQLMGTPIYCFVGFDYGGISPGTTVGTLERSYFMATNTTALNKSGNSYEWVVIGQA